MPHSHKDPANIDMIGRMITSAGRHVAGLDPADLARLAELRNTLDDAIGVAVTGQRDAGVFWTSIAEALGVTKEAAVQRYLPRVRANRAARAARYSRSA